MTSKAARKLSLLVIDDSPSTAARIQKRLQSHGYDLFGKRATTHRTFSKCLAGNSWDVIICKEPLKKFSTLGVLELLKEKQRRIPVIVVSKAPDDQQMLQLMSAGVRDYIKLKELVRIAPVVEREMTVLQQRRDQQRLEKSLRHSERNFRNLIENASDGIAILDLDGTIRYESPAVERMLGYRPSELIGKNAFEFVHPQDAQRVINAFLKGLKVPGDSPQLIEYRCRHKNGTWHTLETRGRVLRNDQVVEGVIINYWDITQRKAAEERLRQSENRYRGLVEQASDAIFITDREGNFLNVNSSGCKLLNYRREELLLMNWRDLVVDADDDNQWFFDPPSGFPSLVELELQHRSGKLIPVEISLNEFEDGRYQGIARDITVRRQTEEVLRNIAEGVSAATGEAFFRSLVRYLADFLGQAYAIVAETSEENPGVMKTLAVYCDGAIVDNFEFDIQHSPVATVIGESGVTYPGNVQDHYPEDDLLKQLYVNSYVAIPLKQVNRRAIGALIVMDRRPLENVKLVDLMLRIFAPRAVAELERKKADQQLKHSEEKYRLLFQESKDAVFIGTPQGKFLDINPAGVELLGYRTKEDLLKFNIGEKLYVNPADREALFEELQENGHVKDFELVLRRRGGQHITVLQTAVAVFDRLGNMVSYRGILRDITERKNLREQLARAQKLEAIGTLAGGIAHDFNNILAIILAFTELTRDETAAEEPSHFYLDQIVNAVKRAKELVKQILTFSRRQMDQVREPIHIHMVVEETLKMLRASIPSFIEVRQKINKKSRGILADPTQVHQVVMNLCTNAYQAMREEGGTMEVVLDMVDTRAENVEPAVTLDPGDYVRLRVSDTGHGIDQDTLRRIFDPFFTTKRIGEGSGMGLSVVHGIVKSHGGAITATSEPGSGTTFFVYFPVYEGEIMPAAPIEISIPVGNEHILLVDDDKELAGVEKKILEKLGYTVTLHTSSAEALAAFDDNPGDFDLVITDQVMPKLTGSRLAQQLLKIRSDIPVILLTGYGDLITPEKARELGICDFLMKPIISHDLGRAIRKVLDDRLAPAKVG